MQNLKKGWSGGGERWVGEVEGAEVGDGKKHAKEIGPRNLNVGRVFGKERLGKQSI